MSIREFIDFDLKSTYSGVTTEYSGATTHAMLQSSLVKAGLNPQLYMQVDSVIKNQLYSRDMAGYTTSYIAEEELSLIAPPWVTDMNLPHVKDKYKSEIKAFHLDYALRQIKIKMDAVSLPNSNFLEFLFHVRKKK